MNEIEFENKLVGLKTKYQDQFKKIYESNEEFKGAMPQTIKFEGQKPVKTSSEQDSFAGATASKPPSPGFSN